MNADVDNVTNNEKNAIINTTNLNHSTPILGNGSEIASTSTTKVVSSQVENMDTQPLDEHFHNLQNRGVSIHLSNNALLFQQQQQQKHSSQPLEQRALAHRQLAQQHHLQAFVHKQLSNKSKFVQSSRKTKGIIKSNKSNKNDKIIIKRRKSANNNSADSLTEVDEHTHTHSNRFALLSELNISSIDMHNVQPVNNSNALSDTQHISRDQSQTLPSGAANRGKSHSAKFCPPIILYSVDISSLVSQFKSRFPDIEIKIINSSKNKAKLYVKDIHAYTTIMGILKDRKISSHSFTPVENRQVAIILRGLHRNTPPMDIKEELESIIPNTISDVKVFVTPHMKKHSITSDLFLVTLLPGMLTSDIINIKYLLLQKVSWEKPHASTKSIQCKRCQRWGHIAKNCNHLFQCVKCDKTHEPGQCGLIQSENSEAYCVNCKKWGHPANFRGCEVYKLLLSKKLACAPVSNSALTGPCICSPI